VTREAILRKAESVFAERGFAGAAEDGDRRRHAARVLVCHFRQARL
jgi:hypothetical protein